ncbi:putative GPI-anchored cell wall protein Pst1, partial [Aspergillus ibericus CBS 121593]
MIPPQLYPCSFLSSFSVCLAFVTLQGVFVAGDSSSNSSCSSSSITLTTQSDADSLSSCDTISGTLSISTSASGSISLSNVQTINGGLTIQNVTSLTAFSASDLQTVHGKIYIAGNDQLSNLSLSDLQTVGGEIDIQDNDDLRDLVFQELEKVEGALVLEGVFDDIKFPSLKHAKGQTLINSHGGSFRCSSLDSLRNGKSDDDDDNDNDDDNTRKRNNNNNNSSSSSSSSSNNNGVFQGSYSCTDGSSSGLSTGAKAGIAIAVIVLVLLILFLVWTVVKKRRIRRRRRNINTQDGNVYTAVGTARDEEKVIGSYEKPLPLPLTGSLVGRNGGAGSEPMNVVGSGIPRKPLSPPPVEDNGMNRDGNRESMLSTSPPVPAALLPGDRTSRSPPLDEDGRSLFLHPIPRRRPSETDVPLLDSGDVHEAPGSPMRRETFELDAGPVRGTHQQPINH